MAGDGTEERAQFAVALDRMAAWMVRLSPSGDVSLTAAGTLATLQRAGPHRLCALAERERVTQPSMTALLTRLQERGLVRRFATPGDRRVVNVAITEAGRQVLASRREMRATRLAQLLARLSADDQAALLQARGALMRLAEVREQDTAAVSTTS